MFNWCSFTFGQLFSLNLGDENIGLKIGCRGLLSLLSREVLANINWMQLGFSQCYCFVHYVFTIYVSFFFFLNEISCRKFKMARIFMENFHLY